MTLVKSIIFGISTTRADYGIQRSLFKSLDSQKNLEFILLVMGTHMTKKFGFTYNEIKKDNYKNIIKLNSKFSSDSEIDLSNQISKSYMELSKLFNSFRPNLLIVLGDRFELLPIVSLANIYKVKVIHIHGGEITDGSMDNATRNAISHLSNYHLVSNDKSKNILFKQGKKLKDILNIGSLAISQILSTDTKFLDYEYFKQKNISNNHKIFLVVYHPNTISNNNTIEVSIFFDALKAIKDVFYVFIMPNVDPGSVIIQKAIKRFTKKNKNSILIPSLSSIEFYSLVRISHCVVGNSSSGIIEVPSLKTFTLNVGDRQKGRLQARSIINCKFNKKDLVNKINLIKNKEKPKKNIANPYFKKNSLELAVKFIKNKINI